MTNYILEQKDSFTVLGIGVELKSDYTDFVGLNKEKSDFWSEVSQNGRLASLKAVADNEYIFAVNEAINGKMMHYAGVLTKKSAGEGERLIQFPKGEYLIVKGEANTLDDLNNNLAGLAFGQILPEANFAYVGGPNTTIEMGNKNGLVFGELWIPVIRK